MVERVVVVGGGPAGLATALAARLEGLSVTLVERSQPPIDKACGEGLMPDGVACLERWGVELDADACHPFHGIRYLDGPWQAEGRFPGVQGLGARRLALHQALARRAAELEVDLRWCTRVTGVEERAVVTQQGRIAGDWIVAADGLRSSLRSKAGLDGRPCRHQRFGVRRHFRCQPWSDCVEVYWARDCEAYVTPVASNEVGVAILWSGRKASFDTLASAFPDLTARLAGRPLASQDRGMGPLRQRARRVYRDRLALVGDASGYVDAITGEGLSLAFHQAEALAKAMAQGDLRRYARAHRRIGRMPDTLTRLMLWIERRPWLRRRVVRALAREPELFSRILAIHCRARPLRSLGAKSAPRLLWRLVEP